ncbi:hypothetical protein Tco_1242656 [Tanacetum coccineum]
MVKRYPNNYFLRNSLRRRMTTIEDEFWEYHSVCSQQLSITISIVLGTHKDHSYRQTKRFPHYDKLRTIFVKDTTKGSKADGLGIKAKDVVKENQTIPCLEDKELHVSENLSSFYGVQESESSKHKRNEGDEAGDNCVESKVANHGSNAVNDTTSKVASQMKDLPRLILDERLMAMSVIGRSEPLSVMFDQLDQERKVRMAQMVAVVELMVVGEGSGVHWWRRVKKVVVGRRRYCGVMVVEEVEWKKKKRLNYWVKGVHFVKE